MIYASILALNHTTTSLGAGAVIIKNKKNKNVKTE